MEQTLSKSLGKDVKLPRNAVVTGPPEKQLKKNSVTNAKINAVRRGVAHDPGLDSTVLGPRKAKSAE